MNNIKYYIGIDPGVNTGIAIWCLSTKKIILLKSLKIHKAMQVVEEYKTTAFIRCEDARKRKWFNGSGREALQGAGSIKRDCKIWDDYLEDIQAKYELVAPKNNKTKLDAAAFKKLTSYQGQTNEHTRDAAMLVFGY